MLIFAAEKSAQTMKPFKCDQCDHTGKDATFKHVLEEHN